MGVNADPRAVSERAYRIWMEHGCPPDSAEADWLEAERQLSNDAGEPPQDASQALRDGAGQVLRDGQGQAAGGALERANIAMAADPEQKARRRK